MSGDRVPSPAATSIHPSAVVHAEARLGRGVVVGPYAVIEAGVIIGDLRIEALEHGVPPAVQLLWKGKSNNVAKPEGLHSLMSTPIVKNGHVYGVCAFGELRCLKVDNGDRVWSTRKATTSDDSPTRWANAFLVAQGDRFFLFNELGDLIIARLTPKGYDEVSRAHILAPTSRAGFAGQIRNVLWSHPAFANKSMYARNDKEIVCVSLAAE